MENETKIDELLCVAVEAGLDGLDFVSPLGYDVLREGYNGIGPEFLPPELRAKVTEFLSLFEPAALVHDLRNHFGDGSKEGFLAANDEFRRNCLKLADWRYGMLSFKRYRARACAWLLYAFVSADGFGWKAWLEASEKRKEREQLGA